MRVEAVERQQILVRAAFGDRPAVQHDDLIGVADRGEAVGDHKCRPAQHQTVEGATNVAVPTAGHFRVLGSPKTHAAVLEGIRLLAAG